MKPYPSAVPANTSKWRPVIGFSNQQILMRFPTVFRHSLTKPTLNMRRRLGIHVNLEEMPLVLHVLDLEDQHLVCCHVFMYVFVIIYIYIYREREIIERD